MQRSKFLRRQEKPLRISPVVLKVLKELQTKTSDNSDQEDDCEPSIERRELSPHQNIEFNHSPADEQILKTEVVTQTESPLLEPAHCLVPMLSFQYTDESDMILKLDTFVRSQLSSENSSITGQTITTPVLDLKTEEEKIAALLDLQAWRKDLDRYLL